MPANEAIMYLIVLAVLRVNYNLIAVWGGASFIARTTISPKRYEVGWWTL